MSVDVSLCVSWYSERDRHRDNKKQQETTRDNTRQHITQRSQERQRETTRDKERHRHRRKDRETETLTQKENRQLQQTIPRGHRLLVFSFFVLPLLVPMHYDTSILNEYTHTSFLYDIQGNTLFLCCSLCFCISCVWLSVNELLPSSHLCGIVKRRQRQQYWRERRTRR